MNRSLCLVAMLSLSMTASACARSSAPPLPGDSVSADGAVTLSPPRFSTTSPSRAAGASGGAAAEPLGPIESRLFPAELVMDHQRELALEPAQREAITKEVTRTQAELVRLQWELASEKDKLVSVLDTPKVDEAKSKAAAAELMDRENKIKAVHLAMLVRIKNLLTPAQQDKLRASREAERCAPPAAASAAGLDAAVDARLDAPDGAALH
jgi:Spy/CpxP family protein refolding chaperone